MAILILPDVNVLGYAFRSTPTPMPEALRFVEALRRAPNAIPVTPGPLHFEIFAGLCRLRGLCGNLVPDAFLAALAMRAAANG